MPALRNEKDRLYHYVCGIALAEVFRSTPSKEIHVILDKRQRKRTVKNDFNRHIESKADECHTGYFSPILKISHFDSTSCEGLQVHDFVVGAIFRNIERDDSRYYDLIKERIIAGKILW
jgi:hypothetical protein